MRWILVLLVLITATPTWAATLNGMPICTSEETLQEMLGAVARDDDAHILYLLGEAGECAIPRSDLLAFIIDRTWTGVVKVRLVNPATRESIIVWTTRPNVVDGEE